jgi:hypothetical protein
MAKVLLYQLDSERTLRGHPEGKLPNLALMKIAAHHRALGDKVELRFPETSPQMSDTEDEIIVYGSVIFEKSRPAAKRLLEAWPDAIIGGTGWDLTTRLEDHGIDSAPDYSIYPEFRPSVGFSQRGCRLKCPFCVVPSKEGKVKEGQTIHEIWRGDPWPREIVLLDNDFFGQPNWRDRIAEMRDGGFKVNFNQGINARFLDEETAKALASVDYHNRKMDRRQVYTAWDSRRDEKRVFRGLELLKDNGIHPRDVTVYILVGFWKWEDEEDRLYRYRKIKEFGCHPYPMPYTRAPHLVGFQRWICGHYHRRIPWEAFKAANYRPSALGSDEDRALVAGFQEEVPWDDEEE